MNSSACGSTMRSSEFSGKGSQCGIREDLRRRRRIDGPARRNPALREKRALRQSDLDCLETEDVGDGPVEPGLLAGEQIASERRREPVGERRCSRTRRAGRCLHAGDYPHPRRLPTTARRLLRGPSCRTEESARERVEVDAGTGHRLPSPQRHGPTIDRVATKPSFAVALRARGAPRRVRDPRPTARAPVPEVATPAPAPAEPVAAGRPPAGRVAAMPPAAVGANSSRCRRPPTTSGTRIRRGFAMPDTRRRAGREVGAVVRRRGRTTSRA